MKYDSDKPQYLIGTVEPDGELTAITGRQTFRCTKKAAIKEYYRQIERAKTGETVICYLNSSAQGYPELMPNHFKK